MAKYRVLAIDGGGVRGLFTTLLLERLCRQPGLAHVFDHVDLVAGNSSGALIALAMAHGLGQSTMLATLAGTRLAFEKPREVFGPQRVPIPVLDWLAWLFWTKYRSEAGEKALKTFLGEHTLLRDLSKRVLVTSFDLDNEGLGSGRVRGVRTWKPKIFHNFTGANTDRDVPAWKVALYSTSALTYFPSVDGYVDGGFYANNPAMCALAQVFDSRYEPNPKPALDEVLLLSVGAGQNLNFVEGKTVNHGLSQWALGGKFVQLTMDATVGVADYQCRQLLGDSNYTRLNPDFSTHETIALDDFDELEFLEQHLESPAVTTQIERTANWLREHWMAGVPSGPIVPEFTSKHVGTATELTCLMPIRPGFIPVLDTRTYATRLRVVFKVLQELRTASREQLAIKPILDIVDAARTVHAFSWAIVAERQLLLNVTFDRPWEPYIRIIWKDLGPLLDLIICNCEGFVSSTEGYEPFAAFVRRHQVDAGFFYPGSSLTIDDQEYLSRLEKLQRDSTPHFDNRAATLVAPGPAAGAQQARKADPGEAVRQWSAVLDVLYGLRSYYPPESADHAYLLRATRALLSASRPAAHLPRSPALEWFDAASEDLIAHPREKRTLDPQAVQGGILRPYTRVTHGCLLLARIDDPVKARSGIALLQREVTRGHIGSRADPDQSRKAHVNVSFTYRGLRELGVKESELSRFPKEFREGMDARAGLLGDVRENHPENWRLPELNVHWTKSGVELATPRFTGSLREPETPDDAVDRAGMRVRLSTVDLVLSLQAVGEWGKPDTWTPAHPLYGPVDEWCRTLAANGIQVVSLQPLRRLPVESDAPKRLTRDHFGFLDGISQPKPVDDPALPDEVAMGELFVGFQNNRGDPPFPEVGADASGSVRGSLLDAGTFLVVRKLRQHVHAFRSAVLKAESAHGISENRLLTKMVGRDPRDGRPLAAPRNHDVMANDFDFGNDAGTECPFHAHIRRGNPRLERPLDGAPKVVVPRLMRRSLAYGPDFANGLERDEIDRGMMFMAYNASISEQFEIIQRWMSGGNTPAVNGGSGVFSGQPDPLLGLADSDGKRTYRFLDGDRVCPVDLGEQPFVTLQWGLYLFTPSMAALKLLADDPQPDVTMGLEVVAVGERVIRQMNSADDWAAVLEDISLNQSGATAAVFAAIRMLHGGVLRTPYGVLVAGHDLAMKVLQSDPAYSVGEYQHRFAETVGESYLGMDRGRSYEALASPANATLESVTESQAYEEAHRETRAELGRAIRVAEEIADHLPGQSPQPAASLTVPLEPVLDYVLAKLAQRWFDIPDGVLIKVGGRPADDTHVHCPFSFLAPSRYVFSSPNPRDTVAQLGAANGQRLLDQARIFVKERRRLEQTTGDPGLKGEISRRLFQGIREDDDLLARTLLGFVFGFVPTVYGNALQILGLWLGDDRFWRVQQRVLFADSDQAAAALRGEIARAMQMRPVPPLLYRTVTEPVTLGTVALRENDRVVIGMSGVTQDQATRGIVDVMPIFGGDRRAADHPTHACPGYHLAMGVLGGFLRAVFDLGPLQKASALVTVRVPRRR